MTNRQRNILSKLALFILAGTASVALFHSTRFDLKHRVSSDLKPKMGIIHIVMFEFKEDVTAEGIADVRFPGWCHLYLHGIDGSQVCNRMLALKDKCLHPTTNAPYVKMAMGGKENSPEGIAVSFNLPALPLFPSTPISHSFYQIGLVVLIPEGRHHPCFC
jgi:hypothetical protein